MGYNAMLQVGGGARTIGSLSTNGGAGPFIGGVAGGTMGASTNGTSVVIENAASTAGTLTITQSTPASTEVQWNAFFRDGTLNSEFFAPGTGPAASASLNVVKAGDGWATLTTDNDYTGTTLVSGGTLQVGRSGVGDTGAAGAAGLTANAGTTIAGTGIIQGGATINGNLKPGDEAGSLMGTLIVNGDLSLGAASVTTAQVQRATYTAMNALKIQDVSYSAFNSGLTTDPTYSHLLDQPVTTSQHDQLIVAGAISVTSGGKFVLANQGYNPTAGDVFKVVDFGSGNLSGVSVGGYAYNGGSFRTGAESGTGLDLFQLGNGYYWDVSQFQSSGTVIVVQADAPREVYWKGSQSNNWTTNNAGTTNWVDGPNGANTGTPFMTDNVHFTANTPGNTATTLGQDFTVNSVSFNAANAPGGVSIAGGNTLTVTSAVTVNAGSGPVTIDANLAGSATVTMNGSESLLLNGTNTYTGDTVVNSGTLGGTGGTIAGDIIVNGGATAGGTLTAGTATSTGTLTVGGSITATSGVVSPTWLVNLSGGSVDLIAGTTIDPTNFILSVQDSGAVMWQTYTFATYNSGTGWTVGNLFSDGVSTIADGGVVFGSSSNPFILDYDFGGNSFTLTAVPEPEMWVPAFLALALGWFLSRRRRQVVVDWTKAS